MSIEDFQDTSLFGERSAVDPEGVVGKAAASAHDTVDRAAQKAQSAFDCLHGYMDQAVEAPRNVIRDNPVAAVVLALSLGFLWGRLGASRD
jgi:ElaB/YqjD/DUF883 family membrane-anchored ribosome-binding protein